MVLLFLLFLMTNISPLFEYCFEKLFTSYCKYLVSAGIIALLGMLMAFSLRNTLHHRRVNYIQWEWYFLIIYGFFYLLNHQFLRDQSGKPFGISSYTLLAIQNLAVVVIGNYLLLFGTRSLCKKILITYLFITAIDCIYSLYVLSINDQALRISSWVVGTDVLSKQGLHGVSNSLSIYSFVTMLPILFHLVRHTRRKLFPIAAAALLIVVTLVSGYTLALLMVLAYCVIAVFLRITKNRVIRIAGISLAVLLLICVDWANIFLSLSNKVSNPSMRERLYFVYNFLENGGLDGDFAIRMNVYTRGLEGFLRSPLWGNALSGNRILSEHSTIIDTMSDWGLIGITSYILFLRNMIKAVSIANTDPKSKVITHTFVLYLATITLNSLGRYATGTAVIAILLPAVLILTNGNTSQPLEQRSILRKF